MLPSYCQRTIPPITVPVEKTNLGNMVDLERSLALHVEIPISLDLVELAHDHLLTRTGQLDGSQLGLVVSFERRRKRGDDIALVGREGLDVCDCQ